MKTQEMIGADIAMVFDHLVGLPATRRRRRCDGADPAMVGTGVGGSHAPRSDLCSASCRAASIRVACQERRGNGGTRLCRFRDWRPLRESPAERSVTLDAVADVLPVDKPRYVMGLGDTEGARRSDGSTCSTACGRPAWSATARCSPCGAIIRSGAPSSRLMIGRSTQRASCFTCTHHSRAYLRHLRMTGELLTPAAEHPQPRPHVRCHGGARTAIAAGRFAEFKAQVILDRSSDVRGGGLR